MPARGYGQTGCCKKQFVMRQPGNSQNRRQLRLGDVGRKAEQQLVRRIPRTA